MKDATSIKQKLAIACRIIASEDMPDGTLGHISVRAPGEEAIYMKPYGLGMEEVTAQDILKLDLEGNKLEGSRQVHGEFVIHTEVYRARPKVQSVVHVHSPYATALSSTGRVVLPITHDGVFFPEGVALFDETPEVLVTKEQGLALARKLGERRAILIKNHGVVVAGDSLEEVCAGTLYLENAARMQLLATLGGDPQPIASDIAQRMFPRLYGPAALQRIWDYHVRRLRRAGKLEQVGS